MTGGGKRKPSNSGRIDDLLLALSHHVRRDVVACLIDRPQETVTLDELAEDLMARHDVEAYNDRRRVAMLLRHTHVPTLAKHRIVEYDPREGRVRYRGDAELETLLDTVQEWGSE